MSNGMLRIVTRNMRSVRIQALPRDRDSSMIDASTHQCSTTRILRRKTVPGLLSPVSALNIPPKEQVHNIPAQGRNTREQVRSMFAHKQVADTLPGQVMEPESENHEKQSTESLPRATTELQRYKSV